jgi:hypothetical protein
LRQDFSLSPFSASPAGPYFSIALLTSILSVAGGARLGTTPLHPAALGDSGYQGEGRKKRKFFNINSIPFDFLFV